MFSSCDQLAKSADLAEPPRVSQDNMAATYASDNSNASM
jgi:hypothetical protein